MKRKFIINPRSGKAVAADAIAGLETFFTAKTGGFDYVVTTSRDAAVRATRESLQQGIDQVVAVGGDGTLNAVANGFFENGKPIRPESSLALANAGTGSDYYRSVVGGTPVRGWKEVVLNPVVRPVDIGRIHYSDPIAGDQYFINMASVGMIAEVAGRKEHASRWLPPKLRYLLPTIRTLLSYRPKQVQVEVDGERLDLEVLAISIAKGVYAGGGMRFGGEVTLSDGLFDITCFQAMKPAEILVNLRKLYTGRFQDEPAIQKWKARKISIRAPSAMPVEFDGDVCGTTDIDVSLEPKSLRICFAKKR